MITTDTSEVRRLNRLRRTDALRALRRETRLAPADFVQPLFIAEDAHGQAPITSLPGITRLGLDDLDRVIDDVAASGVRAVLLFGLPAEKDDMGSSAWAEDGVIPQAVTRIKRRVHGLAVITDVCLCQYTSHGLCGLPDAAGRFDERTLEVTGAIAAAHAAAGADLVAPSGMHDGGVKTIRSALDNAGFGHTGILSYAVKYASAFYGPFREAARSAPKHGDRRSHQMDPGNGREALAEAAQDFTEGADAIIIKPAGPSLDVIARLRSEFPSAVLAGYQVSGEYAMLAAAAERGWLDERPALMESLTAIKRAGADFIITYAAVRAARWAAEELGVQA